MISDFRRVHATSPCLSTAIGNRQLPRDEGLDHQIFGFLFRFVAVPRAAGGARCTFLYQTGAKVESAQRPGSSQARESRADNFFTFVTEETQGLTLEIAFRA
jgi:hypothetical protein